MEIWLQKGSTKFRLPVNPPEFSFSNDPTWEDVTVVSKGERTVFNGDTTQEFTFSSFYPKAYNSSYCVCRPTMTPNNFNKVMNGWLSTGAPIRLIVTSWGINTEVSIRSFSRKEQAGANGDLYFDVTFKAYKPLKVTVLKPSATTSKPKPKPRPPSSTKKPTPKTYVVKRGDCLWNISKKYYGKGSLWPKIYNHPQNKKVIGKNPNLIYPGQKLIIP